jgi:ABC-2 type transport system permease protein
MLIFRRQLAQLLRAKIGLLFGLLQPMLYLVLFGPLLSGTVPARAGATWQQTFVPGLLVMLGLFSAAFAGFGTLIDKQHGVTDRLRVTPVSRTALLAGRTLCDTLQLLAQSTLLVLTAVAMGLRTTVWGVLLGFLLVGLLTMSLSALSHAFAMKASSPQEFAPVISTLNVPAMLLSGILLPMSLAPGWLDLTSRLVPFRYLVDAQREVFLGHYLSATVGSGAAVAVVLCAATLWLGTRSFVRSSA